MKPIVLEGTFVEKHLRILPIPEALQQPLICNPLSTDKELVQLD